jgi:hypothetical protein
MTGLTRRRLAITSFPKLGFDELRSAHCEKIISQVLRGGKGADDSDQIHAYRLALLMELEALRLWDRFDWIEAINAQARLALEQARRNPRLTGMAFHGLTLAIQSFDYSSETPAIHDAVLAMDFAPMDQRIEFLSRLLAAQDVYAYQNLKVLTEFADAIPETLLDQVADWSLKYLKLAESKTLTGSTSIPLKFWQGIVPYLDEASPVWERLLEPVLKMARHPMAWQMDEKLFVEYLCNAPERLAVQVISEMLAVAEGTDGDRFCRWSKLSTALLLRPQLAVSFGSVILASAPSDSDRYRVAKGLKISASGSTEEAAARAHLRIRIDHYIDESLKSGGSFPTRGGYRGTSPSVVTWTEADADIITRLVDAINAPGLKAEYSPDLLMLLRLLLHGCPASVVLGWRETLLQWMAKLPGSGSINNGVLHPWVATREKLDIEIEHSVILLATEVWLKIADQESELLAQWAAELPGLYSDQNPAALVGLYLRLAHEVSGDRRSAWMGFFQTQVGIAWGKYQKSADNWVMIRDVVNETREFLEEGYQRNDRLVAIAPEFVRAATNGMEGYWIEFARAPSPNLRAATARLLRVLQKTTDLSPKLKRLLEGLATDARARVRKAAAHKS